jgi:hypothetical protein
MAAIHGVHSSGKVALAVQARYVSTSLLAEGKEGTLLTMSCVPSRRVRDAHR